MQLKRRSYQRAGGIFYRQENGSFNRGSLRTKDRAEAERLLLAMNEACYRHSHMFGSTSRRFKMLKEGF